MYSSSPSSQPLQVEYTHEFGVVREDSPSPNEETLNHSDPPPPPVSGVPPQPPPGLEDKFPDEEEESDDGGGEIDGGQEKEAPDISSVTALLVGPPITAPHESVHGVTTASPHGSPIIRRGAGKRRKGKANPKKQQAIDLKFQVLMEKLNPIPFIPKKIPHFAKHEKLLKKLGLWDFVHSNLDRNIRVDFIAQLIAAYEPRSRASYVDGLRIGVSRVDLARAFKLPVKKKRNADGADVDLEHEPLSDESIGFISELVSDWLLLHEEDPWMIPNEVTDCFKLIRDGHLVKVDWASMFWFMVEKELKQGGQLRDCHYASHLQHLIKCQHEHLFCVVKSENEHFKEEDLGVNSGGEIGVNTVGETINNLWEKDSLVDGPRLELTLGQDSEKEDGVVDIEMLDAVEKCKGSDGVEDEEEEEEREDEQTQWHLNGKNDFGEHFMRRCGAEYAEAFGSFEEKKDEKEKELEEAEKVEEEDGDGVENNYGAFPCRDDSLDDPMAFNPQDVLRGDSSMDMRVDHMPSFFNNTGKRVLEHDDTHLMHHPHERNKKLRIGNSWDHIKYVDFGICMEQIQQVAERARMLYEEKSCAFDQSNMNQQILLAEIQKRDSVIANLHRTQSEEMQRKDGEIYRLQCELNLMETLLEGYRKALKETRRSFAEYRDHTRVAEEPTYKDVGAGGLMLTVGEIKKLRKKQEEEFRMHCFIAEQKMRESMEYWDGRFSFYVEKIEFLEDKLTGLAAIAKELIELCGNRKTKQIEEMGAEVSKPHTEELATEAWEPQSQEKLPEVEEPPLAPQSEEKDSEPEEPQLARQSQL